MWMGMGMARRFRLLSVIALGTVAAIAILMVRFSPM